MDSTCALLQYTVCPDGLKVSLIQDKYFESFIAWFGLYSHVKIQRLYLTLIYAILNQNNCIRIRTYRLYNTVICFLKSYGPKMAYWQRQYE